MNDRLRRSVRLLPGQRPGAWRRTLLLGLYVFALWQLDIAALSAEGVSGYSEPGDTNYPGRKFEVVGETVPPPGEVPSFEPVLDPYSGHLLYGVVGFPPHKIEKYAMGEGDAPPRLLASLPLESRPWRIAAPGALGPDASVAYFAMVGGELGTLMIVSLGETNQAPVLLGTMTLEEHEGNPHGLFVEDAQRYLYVLTFGASTRTVGQPSLVKFAIDADESRLRRIADLPSTPGRWWRIGVDGSAGRAYFFSHGPEPTITVVSLGEGDAAPHIVASVVIDIPSGGHIKPIGLDTATGQLYLLAEGDGTDQSRRLLTFSTGEHNGLGELLHSTEFPVEGGFLGVTLYDPERRSMFLTVGGSQGPVSFHRLALEPVSGEPRLTDSLTITDEDYQAISIVADPEGRHAYLGLLLGFPMIDGPVQARLVKIGLGAQMAAGIRGNRITLESEVAMRSMAFHSHAAVGQIRFAIYDNEDPRSLLWRSGPLDNTSMEETLSVAVSEGSPSELTLAPGDYWLTWQSDTPEPVASHALGSHGDGFFLAQPFGEEPEAIRRRDMFPTADRWTQYVVYEPVEPEPVPPFAVAPTPPHAF